MEKTVRMKAFSRILSAVFAAVLSMPVLPTGSFHLRKNVDPSRKLSNSFLGTSFMHDPVKPDSNESSWNGDYVCFGSQGEEPLLFRVLSKRTTAFTGSDKPTMLLDSENVFGSYSFSSSTNDWASSNLCSYLNGQFLNDFFENGEKSAIAESFTRAHDLTSGSGAGYVDGWAKDRFEKYIPLNGERIFVLDVEDIMNTSYGYYGGSGACESRKKGTYGASYWLRNYAYETGLGFGFVGNDTSYPATYLGSIMADEGDHGISPALNIDLSSILFSTYIQKSGKAQDNIYKLTLIDRDIKLSFPSGQKVSSRGSRVSVPYVLYGNHASASKISVLITDKAYTDPEATILFYFFAETEDSSSGKVASFDLPSTLTGTWGTDYRVYLIAEDLHTDPCTDYGSIPLDLSVVKPDPVTGLRAESAGKNRVKLSWSPVSETDGYLVYALKDGKYGYVGMTTLGCTFTDTIALDTDYNFYWVFAYRKDPLGKMIPGGCQKYVFAKGVCLAVTGLKASSLKGSVKLSWTPSSGAEGYLIYGIRPGGSYGYIGMTTRGTSFIDTKASTSDFTFYWVYPYHKNGDTMVVGGTAKYVYGKGR